MGAAGTTYDKRGRLLAAILAVSLIVLISAVGMLFMFAMTARGDTNSEASTTPIWGTLAAAVGSFITSVSSIIGLFLGWKKNKSDVAKVDLEMQKLQLELQKANLEMEKLKKPRKRK